MNAIEQLKAQNNILQRHLTDVRNECKGSTMEFMRSLMIKTGMHHPVDAIESEASARMRAEIRAAVQS